MRDAYAYCERLVREADKDRYLASLFIPDEQRPHVFALYAFNAEIAAIRERTSEAMAGEVRLQWWRDVLAGGAAGAAGSPVATALKDTVRQYNLPRERLTALIEARSFDLYQDPMLSREAFEAYIHSTTSSLFELVATILGEADPEVARTSRPAGIAYGITEVLRGFAWRASRGQLILPLDVLEDYGVEHEATFAGRPTPALLAVLAHFRAEARAALADANANALAPSTRPAFLPLALIDGYLRQMDRTDYDPFRSPVDVPQWRKQWALWRAARRGD